MPNERMLVKEASWFSGNAYMHKECLMHRLTTCINLERMQRGMKWECSFAYANLLGGLKMLRAS